MSSFEVTQIRRDGFDLDRRIDMLAGPQFGPNTIDEVIHDIMNGHHSFYVRSAIIGPPAYLEVMRNTRSNRLFLRTKPDGLYDNNLYSLPEISASILLRRRS